MSSEDQTAVELILGLFVTADNKDRALVNLSRALEGLNPASYAIFEFDVQECPDVAEIARLLATPTVVRYWPVPQVKIIGDLSDIVEVQRVLLTARDKSRTAFVVHELSAQHVASNLFEQAQTVRVAELEKRERLLAEQEQFHYAVMQQLADHARKLSQRESLLHDRERFMARRENAANHADDDDDREATA